MAKIKTKTGPGGSIFAGDLGADYAAEDPMALFNHALANEGRNAYNTSAFGWDFLQNQGFNNVYNQYKGMQAADENLSFLKHMGNTYGVQPTMTARNPYVGDSALGDVVVNQQDNTGRRRRRRR